MVRYLKQDEIDISKWDNCIETSLNSMVYAYSWYLDIVSPDWEALVEDDYESVMPLPVKRKFLLPYLIQPLFVQQLGLFSIHTITDSKVKSFIKSIPKKYFFLHFNLNYDNQVNHKNITNRHNFELSLNQTYENIYKGYSPYHKRKIRRASGFNCSVDLNVPAHVFIKSFLKHTKLTLTKNGSDQLARIIETCLTRGSGETYFVRNSSGLVIAGTFQLIAHNRIINLVSFSSEEGIEKSAMFLAHDFIFQQHCPTNMIYDFEGSMIPGVAKFFEGFGSELKLYPQYKKVLFLF